MIAVCKISKKAATLLRWLPFWHTLCTVSEQKNNKMRQKIGNVYIRDIHVFIKTAMKMSRCRDEPTRSYVKCTSCIWAGRRIFPNISRENSRNFIFEIDWESWSFILVQAFLLKFTICVSEWCCMTRICSSFCIFHPQHFSHYSTDSVQPSTLKQNVAIYERQFWCKTFDTVWGPVSCDIMS